MLPGCNAITGVSFDFAAQLIAQSGLATKATVSNT
jgi:hypothetical protein